MPSCKLECEYEYGSEHCAGCQRYADYRAGQTSILDMVKPRDCTTCEQHQFEYHKQQVLKDIVDGGNEYDKILLHLTSSGTDKMNAIYSYWYEFYDKILKMANVKYQ